LLGVDRGLAAHHRLVGRSPTATRQLASRARRRARPAIRPLGSLSEADDAVQEAWLRLSRADAGDIENLRGWLTTVVARVCLDMLRSRNSRREDPMDPHAVGLALLVVLEALAPAERIAFVLHDMFDLPDSRPAAPTCGGWLTVIRSNFLVAFRHSSVPSWQ